MLGVPATTYNPARGQILYLWSPKRPDAYVNSAMVHHECWVIFRAGQSGRTTREAKRQTERRGRKRTAAAIRFSSLGCGCSGPKGRGRTPRPRCRGLLEQFGPDCRVKIDCGLWASGQELARCGELCRRHDLWRRFHVFGHELLGSGNTICVARKG